jgi:uncharacterized protein GlcG (DUF336 family)
VNLSSIELIGICSGCELVNLIKTVCHSHLYLANNYIPDMNITIEQAQTLITAAQLKAQQIGVPMNIAIVDAGANLKAFVRMDNAWLGSVDISIKKAKTARFFDMESGDIGGLSQPSGPLYNIEVSNGGLISFPGGVPIKSAGEIVGAIGVSGGSVEQDREVALAGVAAFN